MRVLHVIHDFLPRHRAGSEIYAFNLARELQKGGIEAQVLCAEFDPTRPHGTLAWRHLDGLPITEIINNWAFSTFAETHTSQKLNGLVEHVLKAVQPDILHVHNLLNLTMDLPGLALDAGIPSVATLHDFTLLCASGGQRVHREERHICHEIETDRCARCFGQSAFFRQWLFGRTTLKAPVLRRIGKLMAARASWLSSLLSRVATGTPLGVTTQDMELRLHKARGVFDAIELFVAPSSALASDFIRFGMPEDKIRVSDYGFPALPRRDRPRREKRLRIGFVGTLVWHKGAHHLIEAARRLPADQVEILLFGDPQVFPDYSSSLRQAAKGLPVTFPGAFHRHELAETYGQMDVLVVPSLWPENSPLVIHEAFQAGVPVVGSRMGGIQDLVRDGVNGALYEAFSVEELADILGELVESPEKLLSLTPHPADVKTLERDADEWRQVYSDVLDGWLSKEKTLTKTA